MVEIVTAKVKAANKLPKDDFEYFMLVLFCVTLYDNDEDERWSSRLWTDWLAGYGYGGRGVVFGFFFVWFVVVMVVCGLWFVVQCRSFCRRSSFSTKRRRYSAGARLL